jgi:hypothetical protein
MALEHRSLDHYRVRYAAIIDLDASAISRRRAYRALAKTASLLRASGIHDSENQAVACQREYGVRPARSGFATLEQQGLLSVLLEQKVRHKNLGTFELFASSFPRPAIEATRDDIEHFLSLQQHPGTARRIRSELRVCYRELLERNLVHVNPAAIVERSDRSKMELTPALRDDLARIDQLCLEELSASATRRIDIDYFYTSCRWAMTDGKIGELGLAEMLWADPAKLEALTRWWARPLPSGRRRAKSVMMRLFTFYARLLRAWSYPAIEVSDRLRTLKRSLRKSGGDQGALTRLTLADPNPPPAPSREKCVALAETYRSEIAELRRRGASAHGLLINLLQERDLFRIAWRTGIRRSSLAALRLDLLFLGEGRTLPYFDEVPTKKVLGTPVAPTTQVGNVNLSRWSVHPDDVEMLKERLTEGGWDLDAYLKTRDPRFIPWMVARDDTFGSHMRGKRVSPVWRSSKGGHLSVSGVVNIGLKIMRARLGMRRGVLHPMRRRAVIDLDRIARLHPQAAEGVQHLKSATRLGYMVSEESNGVLMFPELLLGAESAPEPAVGTPPETSATPQIKHPRPPRRKPTPKPKQTFTLNDLLRGN